MTAAPREHPKARVERAIAVILFFGILGGGLVIASGMAGGMFKDKLAEAEEIHRLMSRFEAVIERQERLASAVGGGEDTALRSEFMQAANPVVATARLQDRVNALAATSGLTIQRISNAGSRGPGRVAVQMQVTGDVVQLSHFIYTVEIGSPRLLFEALNLSQVRRRRTRNAAPDQQFVGAFTIAAFLEPEPEI